MRCKRHWIPILALPLSVVMGVVSMAPTADASQSTPVDLMPAIGDASGDAGGNPIVKALGVPEPADTNPPTGTILNPLPGKWQTYAYVYPRVLFMDPDGIANASLHMAIDGTPLMVYWTAIGWDVWVSADAGRLADGIHTAEASASDQLGNGPTVLRWSFSMDPTPPEVKITNPVGNPVLTNGSVVLAWTGNDTESGIDHYEVRLDDGPPIDVGNVTSFPFSALDAGVHYFYVRAFDVAGNYPYYFEVAIATVPRASPPPPIAANTTFVVTVSSEMPSWVFALLALSAGELTAIVALAVGLRRGSEKREKPDD